MNKVSYWLTAGAVVLFAFCHSAYADYVKLTARGVNEGTEFTLGCGDGKVLIGVKGKMGMFFGQLEGLCRTISTEGKWLGSTSSTQASGGAGGIYPIIPQSFSLTCPADTAVEGLSGRYDQFVVRITLNCFSQAPVASGIGVDRTISAPISSGDSTPWNEDRCPNSKAGRGFHGKFTTAGVRSLGLVCHSGQSPTVETLAAPDGLAAVNLTAANGTPATTVTPFVQVSWMDRSTYESGYLVRIFSTQTGTMVTSFDRPPGAGAGTRQPLNIADLPGGNFTFNVCSKYSAADGGNLCFGNMPFSIALAPTCNPAINGSVERVGAGTARVRWLHTCTNPTNFIVQVRSGNNAFGTVASTLNGTVRDETFNFVAATPSQVRVCAVFSGQGQTSFCSASQSFQFN